MHYTILTILQHLAALVSIIIAIDVFRKGNRAPLLVILSCYSSLSIIADHISLYYPSREVGQFTLAIFTVIEMITFSFILYQLNKKKLNIILIVITNLIFYIPMFRAIYLIYMKRHGVEGLPISLYFFESISLILPCIAYFIFLFKQKSGYLNNQRFSFWIVTGISSWIFLTTPYYILIYATTNIYINLLDDINPIANIIMHSCLIKAYLCLTKYENQITIT
jgi:hypothetical protein